MNKPEGIELPEDFFWMEERALAALGKRLAASKSLGGLYEASLKDFSESCLGEPKADAAMKRLCVAVRDEQVRERVVCESEALLAKATLDKRAKNRLIFFSMALHSLRETRFEALGVLYRAEVYLEEGELFEASKQIAYAGGIMVDLAESKENSVLSERIRSRYLEVSRMRHSQDQDKGFEIE